MKKYLADELPYLPILDQFNALIRQVLYQLGVQEHPRVEIRMHDEESYEYAKARAKVIRKLRKRQQAKEKRDAAAN
jgi:SOS response regulatory protein OraA/RecX